jgi:hypothetical protein
MWRLSFRPQVLGGQASSRRLHPLTRSPRPTMLRAQCGRWPAFPGPPLIGVGSCRSGEGGAAEVAQANARVAPGRRW